MKTKVTFGEPTYIVKPEEGIVVCIMNVDTHIWQIRDQFLNYSESWFKNLPMVDNFGEFTVKGIAKCSGGDVFNEVLGKRIAEAKAKKQAFGIASSLHNIIIDKNIKTLKEYKQIANNCRNAYITEQKHIDYLCKEVK